MATFRLKSKEVSYAPAVSTHCARRDDIMGHSGLKPGPDTVPEHYYYSGRLTPFLSISTPKGSVELGPAEVAGLREQLDAYEQGTARYSPGGGFGEKVRLTALRMNDAQVKAAQRRALKTLNIGPTGGCLRCGGWVGEPMSRRADREDTRCTRGEPGGCSTEPRSGGDNEPVTCDGEVIGTVGELRAQFRALTPEITNELQTKPTNKKGG